MLSPHAELITRCRDFPRFAARCWTVRDKASTAVPFVLNNAQRAVDHLITDRTRQRRPARVAVLKFRQCGLSTYATALMQHSCSYWQGVVGLSIADKLDLPQQWLRRAKDWHEQTPEYVRPHLANSNQIELYYDLLKSRYFIGSSEGKTPGVGSTLHKFHGSECALWSAASEIERQTFQGIPTSPGSLVLLESTGEMVGDWWYRLWMDGLNGNNDFDSIFLSWLIQDEYRMPADDIADLTKDEQELTKLGADREQLAWRRWMIRNSLGGDAYKFCNQYPHTPEVAFLSGGQQVFTPEQVQIANDTCHSPAWIGDIEPKDKPAEYTLAGNESGSLLIYEQPDARYHYVLGADVQWGSKEGSDFDACYVECLETAKVCARMWGHWDMGRYATMLASLGYHYNTAFLAPERNGQATKGVILVLLGLTGNNWRYPNLWIRTPTGKLKSLAVEDYGWLTDQFTKQELIAFAKEATVAHRFDWCDRLCVQEMGTYVKTAQAKLQAADGCHDDALMARMITGWVAHRLRQTVDLYKEPTPTTWAPRSLSERVRDQIEHTEETESSSPYLVP